MSNVGIPDVVILTFEMSGSMKFLTKFLSYRHFLQ